MTGRRTLSLIGMVISSLFVATGPAEEAGATFPGSNGRIAFSSTGIYTIEPDGSAISARVAFKGGDTEPHFSPDATRIAWEVSDGQVWVMNASGANQHQVPTDAPGCNGVWSTTWSPDATKIAFGKQCGAVHNIFVTNANGTGQATQLTTFNANYPAWSPDGTKIAYESNGRIGVMNADGTNPVELTTDNNNNFDPEWAPDSARLVFSRAASTDTARRVYVMNADGSGITAFTPNDGVHDLEPVFSPDGTKIAYVEDQQLLVMNSNGTNITPIASRYTADTPDWGVVAEFPTCPGFESDPRAQIVGTNGPDELTGTGQREIICGLGGDDVLLGAGGKDVLLGGDGNDRLNGDAGNDVVNGGTGNDVVNGGPGDDKVGWVYLAGSHYHHEYGDDVLGGQAGDDVVAGDHGNDKVSGGAGSDAINGWSGNDTVDGAAGDDDIDGSSGNDALDGSTGNDLINGSEGDDTLDGGLGADRVIGSDGDDLLVGGEGRDRMDGLWGRDLLRAKDGTFDRLKGGKDFDKAEIDRGLDHVDAIEHILT